MHSRAGGQRPSQSSKGLPASSAVTSVVEMGSPEDIHVTDAGVIPLVHLVMGPRQALASEAAHLDRNAARPPRCLQATLNQTLSCILLAHLSSATDWTARDGTRNCKFRLSVSSPEHAT